MSGLKGMALETKAAIVAAAYEFYHLADVSNKAGQGFQQFSRLTGQSTQELQMWQQAMQGAGVSAAEVESNVVTLQQKLSGMLLRGEAPAAFTAFQGIVGGIKAEDLNKPFELLEKAREYAITTKKAGVPEGIANDILSTMGLSDKVIQSLRSKSLADRPTKLDMSWAYTDKEQKGLEQMAVRWGRLGERLEHQFGRLNLKFGSVLLRDVEALATAVFHLADAFAALATQMEKLPVTFGGEHDPAAVQNYLKDTSKDKVDWVSMPKAVLDYITHIDLSGRTGSHVDQSQHVTHNIHTNVTAHGADGKEIAGHLHKHNEHQKAKLNSVHRSLPNPAH